ncbi:MAG: glycoside hydrolase family 140 protein [Planctomycetota bacterium]|nr:glycoside hydrolase family 140 protein [Planctomycetota bacterium]
MDIDVSKPRVFHRFIAPTILAAILNVAIAHASDLPKVQVSNNHRFLVKQDGTPLVWIGDTLWDWYKLKPSELDDYLDKRASQGFTVIQTQVAAYGRANYDGHWCFGGPKHKDITKPQEAYWRYGDLWLEKIEQRGLYAAAGLSWIINHWSRYDKAGDPAKRFSETDFYNYGKWVGNRYKDRNNIIWLGLNEATYSTAPVDKIKAVCRGIRDGDSGNKMLTLHPLAGGGTSKVFGDFVDFNAWQTARFLAPANLPYYRFSVPRVDDKVSRADVKGMLTVWEVIAADYNRLPAKPVIDMEAWYEGHLDDMPVASTNCRATAWHCRRRAYFVIFAGSFGHTYGAEGLAYQIKGDSWKQGLRLPGGEDMGHITRLLSSPERPFLKLIPDQSLITRGQSRSYDSHKQAARASDGIYAYVYSADGSNFSVDLTRLGSKGKAIEAKWFNPRTGMYQEAGGPYDRATSQSFDPPGSPAADNDWILVLLAQAM